MILEQFKKNQQNARKELINEVARFCQTIHYDECLESQNRLIHEFVFSESEYDDKTFLETMQITSEINTFLSSIKKKSKAINDAENTLKRKLSLN